MDFETNERVETPSVKINGTETGVSVSKGVDEEGVEDPTGKKWRASYTVTDTADVSEVTFEISNFNDPAGNTNTLDSRTTDESTVAKSVKIDVSKPQLESGSIVFTTSNTGNDDDSDLRTYCWRWVKRGSTWISRPMSVSRRRV